MKFTCQGLELADAVLKVVKAAAVRSTSPILECIKLKAEDDKLTLTCTDLELTIIKTIKADVLAEGEAVIQAKFFADFAKSISGELITFSSIDSNSMEILYGGNNGVIQCQNAEEFPKPKDLDNPQTFQMSSSDLKDLVYKSSVAVAQDDSRPMLRGVLLDVFEDHIKGVSLDGIRLAMVKKPITNCNLESGIVVTARSLLEITKLLPEDDTVLTIQTQTNHMKIDLGDTIFITRLLGLKKDFITYEKILPTIFKTSFLIDRHKLYSSIERAGYLSPNDRNHIIKLNIKGDNLTLTSESEQGNLTENIEIVDHDQNDLVIEFNGRIISDSLHAVGDEFVKFSFCGEMQPCVITSPTTDSFLYLVMPMRH